MWRNWQPRRITGSAATNQIYGMNKYTREVLSEAVACSSSIAEVLRRLGANAKCGSMHNHIKNMAYRFEIDMSHFTGLRSNSGENHKGGCYAKRTASEVLINHDGCKQKTSVLRRALIEVGRKEECEVCGQQPEWNGMPLRLQIDHINGDDMDDSGANLRFICPNCHTQTSNWGVTRNRLPRQWCKCGVEISKRNKSGMCHKCARNANSMSSGTLCEVDWPSNLAELVGESSMNEVARMLGVSGHTVSRQLKKMAGAGR